MKHAVEMKVSWHCAALQDLSRERVGNVNGDFCGQAEGETRETGRVHLRTKQAFQANGSAGRERIVNGLFGV